MALDLLIMNNGYLSPGMSGGSRNMIDVAQQWARTRDVLVVLPDVAEPLLPTDVPRQTYPSHFPRGVLDTTWTYLVRVVKAYRCIRRHPAAAVVGASSLFHDVVPAWWFARKHRARFGVIVYHLVPKRASRDPRKCFQFALASMAQRVCTFYYRKADAVFAGNRLVHEALLRAGVDPERLRIYYPAVDVDAIRQAQPEPGYDVLFIGRLVARKGIFDLVDAVRGTGLRLGMVGDGEDRRSLETYVARHGMESQVDVLGALDSKRMLGLLTGCACLALPSYEEGYGMVIAEAIAADRPVVAYELPHYAEAFGTAYVPVPPGDRERLRQALVDVAAGGPGLEALAEARRTVTLQTPASGARALLEGLGLLADPPS